MLRKYLCDIWTLPYLRAAQAEGWGWYRRVKWEELVWTGGKTGPKDRVLQSHNRMNVGLVGVAHNRMNVGLLGMSG